MTPRQSAADAAEALRAALDELRPLDRLPARHPAPGQDAGDGPASDRVLLRELTRRRCWPGAARAAVWTDEWRVLAEDFGAALVSGDVFATAFLGLAAAADHRGAVWDGVLTAARGGETVSMALDCREPGVEAASIPLRAARLKSGYALSGRVPNVLGSGADVLLLPAVDAAGRVLIAACRGGAAGIRRAARASLDPTMPLAELRFRRLMVPRRAVVARDAARSLGRTRLRLTLGLACAAVGSMARLRDLSVEHARGRRVFGVPIARRQAVSHRLVDMALSTELLRSLCLYASLVLERSPAAAAVPVAAAKAFADERLLDAARSSVQIHGARGFLWAHANNFFLRRAILMRELVAGRGGCRDVAAAGLLRGAGAGAGARFPLLMMR